MLSREYRLTRERDFAILFNEGRFIVGKLVNAKVWKPDMNKYPKRGYTADYLKFGFVVSTKVSKSAVKRNRIKRQMREVIRLLLKEGKITRGWMIAFIAKPESIDAEYKDIEASIIDILKKAHLV